jgi:hypothetical protein
MRIESATLSRAKPSSKASIRPHVFKENLFKGYGKLLDRGARYPGSCGLVAIQTFADTAVPDRYATWGRTGG